MKVSKSFLLILTLLLGQSSCTKNINEPDEIFEEVWKDYKKIYPYFELKKINWDSVYNVYYPTIDNEKTTETELAKIIGEMTLQLKDIHVSFSALGKTYQFRPEPYLINSPLNAQSYIDNIVINNVNFLCGDISGTKIQYLGIKNFQNSSNFESLSPIINNLNSKSGLIMDLRNNFGGNDENAANLANKITDKERVYEHIRYRNGSEINDFGSWIERKITPTNSINFKNKVVVLTNKNIASSAESFVLMLKSMPQTIIVGDITRGSSGNPKLVSLPNGWTYKVSRWQAATSDFQLIEDRGIAPNFVIFNTEATMKEGRDLILEKAIELF